MHYLTALPDQGTDFIAKELRQWAYGHEIQGPTMIVHDLEKIVLVESKIIH